MDGRQGTIDAEALSQLRQRGVWLLAHEFEQTLLQGAGDQALAPGAVVQVFNGTGVAILLDEFFHHAEGNIESLGDLLACGVSFFPGIDDSGAKIV